MDLESFAAERDADMVAMADLYQPAVDEALAEEDEDLRTEILVAALTTIFLMTYGDEGGDPAAAQQAADAFVATMLDAITKTDPQPEGEGRDVQATRISTWFATATLGAATLTAAESNMQPGEELTKTWVTMRDDAVRETHAPLDGETTTIDGTFTVKTEPPAVMSYPGQPVGPVEAWINCRCVLAVSEVLAPITAAGKGGGFSGVVLVALPEGDRKVTYADGDTTELHQTLAYLGTVDDLEDGEREAVMRTAEELAMTTQPFTARVAGLGTLGEDQDGIAITESRDLQGLHDTALSDPTIKAMYDARNGHPTWISHVTAQDFKAGDEITFDRIGAWFGGDEHYTFQMGEPMTDDEMIPLENPEPEMDDDMLEDDDLPAVDGFIPGEDENQPVYGIMAPEGVMSGDGRSFAPGETTTRELPIPLSWQRASIKEHDGSVVVGRVDNIERREDGNLWWNGYLITAVPETEEVINLIAELALQGVSVDMDSAKVTQVNQPQDEFAQAEVEFAGRVSGLTIVPIPAFPEAFIALGVDPALASPDEDEVDVEAVDPEMAAAADTESFKRGSGWITNPEDTRRIHDYWTKGKGAAKVRWGTPGDFTRLRRFLSKYIEPQYLNRTAAQWHHDALGYWPGECGRPGNPPCGKKRGLSASATEDTMTPAPAITMVAAAPPATVPVEWFSDPGLSAPTPLTVDGKRVFGHIAKWGTCHIGIDRTCVTPPRSSQNYAYFHLGSMVTDGGEIAVGSLTLGTGHADLNMSSTETVRHYDHTGTVVAKVRAGEDEHGIWVAGTLCDGVTDEQARVLASSGGISGDWRSIGGNLELVAALAVNVPGFPVPRPALAASGGHQTSLVAAGVVVAPVVASVDDIAEAVVQKLAANETRKQRLAALSDTQAEVRARRLAALQEVDA